MNQAATWIEMGRMMSSLCLLASAATSLLPLPSFAEGGAKRFPVTTEMVLSAMQYRQLPTDGVEIRLAAPITALTQNPMLDIQSMTLINAHTAQLRVGCRNHSECLPFYVAATWPETAGKVTLPAALTHQPERAPLYLQESEVPAGVIIKAGTPATLLIEGEKVHIRLQVICLEGGSAGDKVRVATPDHKLAYKAEIVAPNLLKGDF